MNIDVFSNISNLTDVSKLGMRSTYTNVRSETRAISPYRTGTSIHCTLGCIVTTSSTWLPRRFPQRNILEACYSMISSFRIDNGGNMSTKWYFITKNMKDCILYHLWIEKINPACVFLALLWWGGRGCVWNCYLVAMDGYIGAAEFSLSPPPPWLQSALYNFRKCSMNCIRLKWNIAFHGITWWLNINQVIVTRSVRFQDYVIHQEI